MHKSLQSKVHGELFSAVQKGLERFPSVSSVVYPHACAEAYIASRNRSGNKLKTDIADVKQF